MNMVPIFQPLADVSSVPSRFEIGGFPFLVLVIGLIIWGIHFSKRKYGEFNLVLAIIAYVIVAGTGVFSYIYNADYFSPVILNASNYWNNQAKVILFASVILPPILAIILGIVDHLAGKQAQRDVDLE